MKDGAVVVPYIRSKDKLGYTVGLHSYGLRTYDLSCTSCQSTRFCLRYSESKMPSVPPADVCMVCYLELREASAHELSLQTRRHCEQLQIYGIESARVRHRCRRLHQLLPRACWSIHMFGRLRVLASGVIVYFDGFGRRFRSSGKHHNVIDNQCCLSSGQ